jgi:hypothetical protein
VLADKIYRNRENINYCKVRGIRLSGPALGRPKKGTIRDKKIKFQDNADRIAVERDFSLLKRCFSMDKIMMKLKETTLSSIGISVIAMNLSKLMAKSLYDFFSSIISIFDTV